MGSLDGGQLQLNTTKPTVGQASLTAVETGVLRGLTLV